MKRILFSIALLLGLGFTAGAQVSHRKPKPKTLKSRQPETAPDNRKIYHFKNGQQATPTGHEATAVNGGYSALEKNKPAKSDTAAERKKRKQ